jgi:ABC-type dipeptide/oligopeptide/nickel transport system permease subunit
MEVVVVSTLAEFGTGQVLWSIIWFTLFFIWIWILISVFADIFRSDDLGGFAKTIWIIFVIVLPYLGVFVYLIARGKGMQERSMKQVAAAQAAQAQYIQSVAGTSAPSASEEIARLAGLRDKGAISEEEFQAAKAKALSS